jgi:predicted double-glycine peptidase
MPGLTPSASRIDPHGRTAGWVGRVVAVAALAVALIVGPAAAEVRFHGEAGGHYGVQVMSWRDIPFRTVVRQQYDFSCGSAAVATLLRFHYRRDVTETQAFRMMYDTGDQAKIRSVGFSMLDMKRYLESVGYRADGFRMSLDRLAQMRVPAIALINRDGYKHFVVIKGVRGSKVLLGDPSRGLEIHERAEFESWWNGIALAIRSGPGAQDDLAFNRDEDWRPWASAPVGAIGDRNRPGDLTRDLAPLYQISPVSQINGGAS